MRQGILYILGVIFLSGVGYAQNSTTDTPSGTIPDTTQNRQSEIYIFSVEYKGLNLIDPNIVQSVVQSKPKTILSAQRVSEDINRLFRLGFFEDIKVLIEDANPKKITLIFEFKEKPQILRIKVTGIRREVTGSEYDSEDTKETIYKPGATEGNIVVENISIGESTIEEKMTLKKYSMLDKTKLLRDIQAIREEYKRKGFFRTTVTYTIKKLPDNFVELNILIDESPKTYLTEINVTGTRFYYPIDIVRMMNSATVDSFSWANSSGVFHEQLLNSDLYQIYNNYQSEGFIKVFIKRPDVMLIHNQDFSRFIIDLDIKENDRYFLGKLDVVSGDENELIVSKERLLATVILPEGAPFNPFKISSSRARMDSVYQSYGYAYAFVVTERTVNEDTKTVDVTFKIFRGEKAYINRVDFIGNLSTQDYVLRRELTFYDSEIYDGNKIIESRQNLLRLGFFTQNGVTFNRNPILERNEIDYNIKLDETFTGSVGGTLTYSETQGLALGVNFSERNFLGRGYSLKFEANITDKEQKTASITFGNSYIFDSKFSSSTSVSFNSDPRDTDYDIEGYSVSQALFYPFWFNWNYVNRFSAARTRYMDVTENGLALLDNDLVKDVFSYRTGFLYNTVNHPFKPSAGREFGIFGEQVGGFLTGDENYRRVDINLRNYIPLNESNTMVFMFNFENSYLFKISQDKEIPANRRFFLGGVSSIRGFDNEEIAGPSSSVEWKDGFTQADLKATDTTSKSDDYSYFITHKGGVETRRVNFELLFPLTREGENMRGVFFLDIGNVFAEDRMYQITNNKKDLLYYRAGYGSGIRIITPAGVIRFEYGMIVNPKKGEPPGKLHFTVSSLF